MAARSLIEATVGHDTMNLVAQQSVATNPVDPVQPLLASMTPESATAAVGSEMVFAIGTSGGPSDATASWECSSSDQAIATATTTGAGCAATGVAAGGVTINTAVTKGEDSAILALQLTVTAPDVGAHAFMLIASVTDTRGNNASNKAVKGTVNVEFDVERGDQNLGGRTLMVNGDVVAHQSFGMAAAPAQDEPADQVGVHKFTLPFDSGEYDLAAGCRDESER